jgi:translation initiation factor IF-3
MDRGREMPRQDLGDELLSRIFTDLGEVAKLEKDSPLTGRKKSIILAPK